MWQWLGDHLAAIGALLGSLVLVLFAKKKLVPTTPTPPVTPPVDPGAEDKKSADEKKVEDQHAHDVAVVVEQEKDQEKDLEDDPNAENDFIKKVGEDVRK
jgi:hypothetical protein